MKKGILFLCLLLWSVAGLAQSRFPVLSPIIFMGSSGKIRPSNAYQVNPVYYSAGSYYPPLSAAPSYQRSSFYAPAQPQPPAAQNKMLLQFEPAALALTESQKQQLVPTLNRVQSGQVRRVTLVGYSSIPGNSYHRLTSLNLLLTSYNRQLRVNTHDVRPENVLPQNDHTVEVIEH